MYVYRICCILLLLVFAVSSSAQSTNTNSLDSFSAKLITTIRANAKEQAYLVTDKAVYKASENIWFNAFLLNTASQKLSRKSRYLFVDVVDENDNNVKRAILDAANQQLYSRIQLPDTLSGGCYWLRAYTGRMAKYDTDYMAVQPLYVLSAASDGAAIKRVMDKAPKSTMPIITFYPEGNNIITGIVATVAIVASDANGAPLQTAGVIKDNHDTIVTNFSTNANGLGKFQFEPSGYRQYKAVIQINGKEWTYTLPPFNFFKGQLAVARQPGSYLLRVLLGDSIYRKNMLSYVVGISKDSLVFAAFGKGLYQVNVEENKLPPGITTFYLFDTAFNLLSERAVYANSNGMQVNITTDKNSYTKRNKVSLHVSVTDAAHHTVPALISLSVSDSLFANRQTCTFSTTAAIHSVDNLFLATHGCFSDEEKDLLMLTKSNTYTSLIMPARTVNEPVNDSLFYISGSVLSKKNEGANKIVTLISKAGNGLFYTDTTDEAGHYRFALDSYPDSMQYALQVKDFNNHVLDVDVVPSATNFPDVKTPAWLRQPIDVSKAAIDKLVRQYNAQWNEDLSHHLPPVMVKDQKEVDYDISKRVSSFSSILSGKDFDGRRSVDNLILKVGGLQLVNGVLVMQGLFSMKGPSADDEPLVLVDGVQAALSANVALGNNSPVLSYLSTLNPKDIDFIEVLKGGAAANYGVRGGNGVILINTNKVSHDFNPGNNMKTFYAQGVTSPVLFPAIEYSEKGKKALMLPDIRSTLFWNGHFFAGDDGKADFTFFTSDVPATYTVTVTGITARGAIIYKTINFRSK